MSGRSQRRDDDAVLDARAIELARPQDEGAGEDSVAMLILTVTGRQVAVPVCDVRAVLVPGPVAQAPGGNGVLTGLVGGHGGALPVASLAGLLGLATARRNEEQWVAVLDHPTDPVGLLVDSADAIAAVGTGRLGAPSDIEGPVAAILHDGTLVLSTEALMRDPRLRLGLTDMMEELP